MEAVENSYEVSRIMEIGRTNGGGDISIQEGGRVYYWIYWVFLIPPELPGHFRYFHYCPPRDNVSGEIIDNDFPCKRHPIPEEVLRKAKFLALMNK